jgi:uncharacterized protein YggE
LDILESGKVFTMEVVDMKRILYLAGLLLLVVTIIGVTGCGTITSPPSTATPTGGSSSQNTGIWVSGTGEVTITPDIAVLEIGVEAQEATVAEAQAEAAAAMDKVMTALTDSGIKKEDIQTRYFRIRQQTRYDNFTDEEIVTGYRVTNTVSAKIRKIENAGNTIDAAVRAGGDLVRINDLNFTVDDPSVYYDEAREKATANAREKAEKLAKQTGVKLGEPTFIAESAYTPSPYGGISYGMSESAIPAPVVIQTPVSPGETEITLTVQIAYSIK